MSNYSHPLMNAKHALSDEVKRNEIEAAARNILTDAKEVSAYMAEIQNLLAKPWEMTATDRVKLDAAIKVMAKAQSNLRKMRDKATNTSAYTK
jgi:CelD/BcsL family acetyltransferase involved in cellulose biosynthesis